MASKIITEIVETLRFWGHNLKTNFYGTFINVDPKNYLRLIAIVGAYLLLRPYLIKLGAKAQRREHEKVDNPTDQIPAKVSANALRGRVEVLDDTDDEQDAKAAASGGDMNWGKKARKRQRQVVKKLLEEDEKRLRELEEAEEDKEFEEFMMRNCATGKEVALES